MQPKLFSIKHIPSETALNMLLYVQSAGNFKCDSSFIAKRKKYNSILVMVTLSGTGYLKYRNKTHVVTEGMVIAIDCNEPHVYFTDKTDLWHFVWVHFKGGQSFDQIKYILDNCSPVFEVDKNYAIKKCIFKILDALPKKGMYCDVISSQYLNDILTNLMLNSLPGGEGNREIPDIVVNAIAALETSYQKQINMDAFAHNFYINKFDLIRKFKKYIGITPYEYLIKYRINESKSLLENTLLSISVIANKVGFEDPSHFIKIFRQYEQNTPLQYRKFWNK